MNAIVTELEKITGHGHVLTGDDTAPYRTDWRDRFRGDCIAVVFPQNTAQVQNLVYFCRRNKLKIIPQGGNTNMVASATPDNGKNNIIINMKHMNRIEIVDPAHKYIMVESGSVLADVQDFADHLGRVFPLQLAPRNHCQIGGAIATNAGGLNVLHYGMMRQFIAGIEAVLPNGDIYNGLYALEKNNAGYDLKHLFIGSEGTLGIITRAILRLYPKPQQQFTVIAAAHDFMDVIRACSELQAELTGKIHAMEYIERAAWDLVFRYDSALIDPFAARHAHYVLIEFQSYDEIPILSDLVRSAMAKHPKLIWHAAIDESQRRSLWEIRTTIPLAEKSLCPSIKQDIAIPVHHWPEFIPAAAKAVATAHEGALPLYFGHLGDGNLHFNIVIPELSQLNYHNMESRINNALYPVVKKFNGSIAAEHGIGQVRNAYLPNMIGNANYNLLRTVKNAIDPDGLFNPGKIF